MKIIRIIGLLVVAWLLLAPIPLIIVDLFNIPLDWRGGWHAAIMLWSIPVFVLAAVIDPIVHGAISLSQYAMIHLALMVLLIVVLRVRRARRIARLNA